MELGHWPTRLSSLEAQDCPQVAAEERVETTGNAAAVQDELGGTPGALEGLGCRRSWKGDQVLGLRQDDDQKKKRV